MKPEQAIRDIKAGKILPLYAIVGDEGFLVDQVLQVLLGAVDTGVAAGFNVDKLVASETTIDTVISAVRTVPMMAPKRLVLLRGVERWDSKGNSRGAEAFDRLASYAAEPIDSSVLIVVANKINGSRKFMRLAKKQGFLVSCSAPSQRELAGWIRQTVSDRGHSIRSGTAQHIAELLGPELGPVADAIERLSLYVGSGAEIDDDAVAQVVTRVRQETVWALVDALGVRDLGAALAALQDAYDPRDGGLPMLGAVAWRVRQLVKYQSARRGGAARDAAAKRAGVPPFRAGAIEDTLKRLRRDQLESWSLLLAEADLALKGSRRPGAEVLASLLVEMCR